MRAVNLPGLICAAALAFTAATGRAGLQWDEQSIETHATLADKEAVAHFKFKNTGDYQVSILTVAASCSCTAAASDKKVYEPGEAGEIIATFTIGRSEGEIKKIITVVTDDPRQKNNFLYLNVSIPPVLTLDPRYLVWGVDEELKPKAVNISTGSDYPVHALQVTSSNPNVKAKLESVPPGNNYKLIIAPKETTSRIVALVKVKADYPADNPKTYFVIVHVR